MNAPVHWLFNQPVADVFRFMIWTVLRRAGEDLARADARQTLGNEDTQCQHYFTRSYTSLQRSQEALSSVLLESSDVEDLVLEFRYYRSVARRSARRNVPQLVERETGADFALTLEVDIPGLIFADRSVMGQAKLIDRSSIPIDQSQLNDILTFAGPESACYMIWGPEHSPVIVTSANVNTLGRVNSTNRRTLDLLRFGQPFPEFFTETFLGLWFGRDFNRQTVQSSGRFNSPASLYQVLHVGEPPPNVIHLSVGTTQTRQHGPGVYVADPVDIQRTKTDD